MSTDTLSEVLRAVRLKGAVYFSVAAEGPWIAEAPPAAELAPHVMPGAEHVIEYHMVSAGRCYGGLVGGPPIALEAGDVLVFPQGDAHIMASAAQMQGGAVFAFEPARTASLPIRVNLGSPPLEPGSARLAESNQATQVICGFLGCDASPFNPLLRSLPRVIHLSAQHGGGALEQLMKLALAESATGAAGSECVLSRVSELLFIEVVRRHIAALPEGQTGWLAGLRDELVGRCLGRLHESPSEPWTLEGLARELGTSRSVLAERFVHFVGIPAMQYLARWRMQLAAGLLGSSGKSLAEIASEVGYGSEAAFSRAFKREVGTAPASFRRAAQQPATPSLASPATARPLLGSG